MTAPDLTTARASDADPVGEPSRDADHAAFGAMLPRHVRRHAWHEARLHLAAHPMAWPAARLVRRFGSVVRVPALGVVINDALLAHDVLVRDRDFRKTGDGSIADVMTQAFGPSALANMDGDAHRTLRQRLGPLTGAAQTEAWLAVARAPLDRAMDALARGEAVDMVRTARLISGRLTLALMGSVPDDAPPDDPALDDASLDVHALGERIASTLQLSRLPAHRLAPVQADVARLLRYAHDAYARPDLPPASLVARLRALDCTAEETRGILSIFFVAGALTLGVAMPRMLALLVDSRQLAELRRDPSLVPRAVDETMRYACPIPATVRIAANATTLGGVRVARGERIVVLTANLARDAALFPDPHRFDITRQHDPRARYLWYGAGPHFCLGFPLAQRVLQLALRRFAELPAAVRIVRRSAARGVLLPAWRELIVRRESA